MARRRPKVCIKHGGRIICGRKVKMPKAQKKHSRRRRKSRRSRRR